jgi:hypothetical protein
MAPGSGVLKDGYYSCARNEGGLGSVVCAVDAGVGVCLGAFMMLPGKREEDVKVKESKK